MFVFLYSYDMLLELDSDYLVIKCKFIHLGFGFRFCYVNKAWSPSFTFEFINLGSGVPLYHSCFI